MPAHSARCYPNRVAISTPTGWAKDAAGGRVPTFAAPSDPVPCSVQFAGAELAGEDGKLQRVVRYAVLFPAPAPAIKARAKLAWVDGGGAVLVALSTPLDCGGRGAVFEVDAEHRPV